MTALCDVFSNLITDMALKGATKEELSRVISASLQALDGKDSLNDIRDLYEKYCEQKSISDMANALEDILKEKSYLDVGAGVERQLGISKEQMNTALLMLQDKGYSVQSYDLPQVSNPKQKTKLKVLCGPDATREELKENLGKITSPDGFYCEKKSSSAV